MFNLKRFEVIALAVLFITSPALVSAQSLADLQAQLQALLSQISALQSQATQTSPILPPVTTGQPDDYGTGVTVGNYCPKLSITMQRGSRDATTGGQVSELQAFLTDYYNLDENIVVGGYFGNLTHKYVVRFQTEQGLPAFGIAGVLTRAKIAQVCGGTPQPSDGITVTAPNGGEQWEIGQLNTITWSPYGYNPDVNSARDVDVYLIRGKCPGQNCESVGKIMDQGKASLHTYFNIDNYNKWAEPGQYQVRVYNRATNQEDFSDAPFTLLPRAVDLKVNGSDGPITLTEGQQVSLQWKTRSVYSCGFGGVGGFSIPVANEVEGTAVGIYSGGNIVMNCIRNGTQNLDAKDWVYVNSVSVPASLKVTSPNGGEQVPLDQTYTIKLKHTGLKSLSIALYRNDQWVQWLTKDSSPPQYMDWRPSSLDIPSVDIGKNIYKIYITGQKADGTGYVDDKSDAPFSFVTGTSTSVGTYMGYLDGSLFITTLDISQADALANCKLNGANNPMKAIRCTWNEMEIYNTDATEPGPEAPTPAYMVFSTVGATTWQVPTGIALVEYLVVGGGGGGGDNNGGGGGGGGVAEGTLSVTAGATLTVVVGEGGRGASSHGVTVGADGSPSRFHTVVAYGGGGGGSSCLAGRIGASGGGGGGECKSTPGAPGMEKQGTNGGNGQPRGENPDRAGGGGGGAGASGGTAAAAHAGNGGAGRTSSIMGTAIFYGGGGGGGGVHSAIAGVGGAGGGGSGYANSNSGIPAKSGAPNTGGGGGGGENGNSGGAGGTGGSGTVIVRYVGAHQGSTADVRNNTSNLASALSALESAIKAFIGKLGQ